MDSKGNKNIPKSDAIWISDNKNKNSSKNMPTSSPFSKNSFDSGLSEHSFGSSSQGSFINQNQNNNKLSSSSFEYKRSFSTQSYGRNNNNNNNSNDYGDYNNKNRRRTMTVANDDRDGFFSSFMSSSSSKNDPPNTNNNNIHQSPTSRSPFQRSNSLSFSIESNFGNIVKRSIGTMFNAATMNTSLATATIQKSVPKVRCVSTMDQNSNHIKSIHDREHVTDRMVSYLCESAIR